MNLSPYIQPRSVTFWAGMVPLLSGLFIATEPVHGLTAYVTAVQAMYDGATPAVLINTGLGIIGVRRALRLDA